MVLKPEEMTPCGVLFDLLTRKGGISHKELAGYVLSDRPLSDGRSPASRAGDRTWVSRFVVHAPVGSLQDKYFCDFGTASQRVMARLKSGRGRTFDNRAILGLVTGEGAELMGRALASCHQDVQLFRNALARFAQSEGYTLGERAEMALVLFVAMGCSANVRASVAYAQEFVRSVHGGRVSTPASAMRAAAAPCGDARTALGLMRVRDGYVTAGPYWVDPAGDGAEVGALATGEGDVTDVEEDVSARHLRVWHDADRGWLVRDLGSTNGTWLASGATGEARRLEPGADAPVRPGDELRLGAATSFVVIEGEPAA